LAGSAPDHASHTLNLIGKRGSLPARRHAAAPSMLSVYARQIAHVDPMMGLSLAPHNRLGTRAAPVLLIALHCAIELTTRSIDTARPF